MIKNNKKKSVRNKKKDNFLKENYRKSWEYLKESKKFIWIIAILFFLSAVIGFLFQPPEITKVILDYIQKILAKTEGMSSLNMILFIFFNNLKIGFMGIIYGFAFGIFPILSILVNGYVVGYVSSSAVSSSGVSSLLNLLPHGIFELPAIFISFGMGMKFGISLFSCSINHFFPKISNLKWIIFLLLAILFFPLTLIIVIFFLISDIKFRKKFFDSFNYTFTNLLRVFIFVVVPLLIIAAIIEGNLIAFLK